MFRNLLYYRVDYFTYGYSFIFDIWRCISLFDAYISISDVTSSLLSSSRHLFLLKTTVGLKLKL